MSSRLDKPRARPKVLVESAELTKTRMLDEFIHNDCIDLSLQINPEVYSRKSSDVLKGQMLDGRDIAIKVWRCFSDIEPQRIMEGIQAVHLWSQIKHENVLEIMGVAEIHGQLGLVSLWTEPRYLSNYIISHPDVDRVPWCIQIASGVSYLHINGIVHGNLRACHILISTDRTAKISGFECSPISNCTLSFSPAEESDPLIWAAPELLLGNALAKTKQTDVYALGMTLLEIMTGQPPQFSRNALSYKNVGRLPRRGDTFGKFSISDAIWDILLRCWDYNPGARLDAQSVLQLIESYTWSPQGMFDLLKRHNCVDLSSQMDTKQDTAILRSGGGFGNIWMGSMCDGTKVAIKAWRSDALEHCDYKTLKRATREIYYWSKMKHDNIHQLIGVIIFKGHYLGMVSQWMEYGNLSEYIRKQPNADRYQLCAQVASGLAYMHSHNTVHGDLKSLNVLVSADGTAKLSDFDLSMMSEANLHFSESSNNRTGSTRWAAPEILLEELPKRSKQADIYALGMTMLEIFTGEVPYPQCRMDYHVIKMVEKGTLPTRPQTLFQGDQRSSRVWDLLTWCWERDPNVRPSATTVIEIINRP